ncbi:MAG: hypothetical protein HY318_09245 [Armatimonadetes bacterium]|nr:hypothetical protein [Armatimonadota bacterium]
MEKQRVTGEPYELAGRRMVFTNWYYVRPGSYGWYDAAGNGVSASRQAALGPWEAQFKRRDCPQGIRLVAQPAQRRGPLLGLERPWEKTGVSAGTLLKEGDRYRFWAGCQGEDGQSRSCCFESKDGITWERPKLGLVEFAGSRDNNLLPFAPGLVFIDPSAPPEERYKGVSTDSYSQDEFEAFRKRRPEDWEHRAQRKDVGHIYGVAGFVSPDGLKWKKIVEPLVVEHSDTQTTAYFDEQLNKYVLYTRNWMVGPRSPRAQEDRPMGWLGEAPGAGRRSIGRTESDSFLQFPLSEVILEPSPDMLPNDLLYTNCKTTIPGSPDQHLLFPAVWNTGTDATKIVMASSRDGKVWNYVPGRPVLETAPFGQWDGGCVFASPNLTELPDGSFVLPYTGYVYPHKYPRGAWKFQPGLAVWPKGRLVALEAEERGEFATVGFIPPGRKLRINAVTQRAGSILVEVADLDGNPIPGRTFEEVAPIIGDQHKTPVTWKGQDDLGHKEGAAIILRFRMDRAQLFGLEFEG